MNMLYEYIYVHEPQMQPARITLAIYCYILYMETFGIYYEDEIDIVSIVLFLHHYY